MPKLYFRSKDVKDVEVLRWAGTCYTRTGEYTSVSSESNVPLSAVEVFYGGCTTCGGGQIYLSAGQTSSLVQFPEFQVKSTLTNGQTATLQLPVSAGAGSSYNIVLSGTTTGVMLDVYGVGGGPYTFTAVGDTYQMQPPGVIAYNITLAALGSHYLTFEQVIVNSPTPTPTLTPTPTPTPTGN